MIEKFHWLRQNIFGIEFNAIDVNEVFKHIKIKYLPENSPVYLSGDVDWNLFFILRGKVSIGSDNMNQEDESKIFKLTQANSRLSKLSNKEKNETADSIASNNNKVYYNGRLCKFTVKE